MRLCWLRMCVFGPPMYDMNDQRTTVAVPLCHRRLQTNNFRVGYILLPTSDSKASPIHFLSTNIEYKINFNNYANIKFTIYFRATNFLSSFVFSQYSNTRVLLCVFLFFLLPLVSTKSFPCSQPTELKDFLQSIHFHISFIRLFLINNLILNSFHRY